MSSNNIAHPDFVHTVDVDKYISKCIELIKGGLDDTTLKSTMYQVYETEFGIHNHITSYSPLSEVEFRNIEDTMDGSPLSSISRTYIAKNIRETFGLSLLEFINLPRDVIELLVHISNDEIKSKQPMLDKLHADIKGLN